MSGKTIKSIIIDAIIGKYFKDEDTKYKIIAAQDFFDLDDRGLPISFDVVGQHISVKGKVSIIRKSLNVEDYISDS